MALLQIRNKNLLPSLETEGVFHKPIVVATTDKSKATTHQRLFSHHTLASMRKLAFYEPKKKIINSLDYALDATYNHSTENFAEKMDVILQRETRGQQTWRRLRNTYDKKPKVIIALGHPLKVGGVKERRSPYSVKLMSSGVHSSQTNPGYSRQPAGGAIFFY